MNVSYLTNAKPDSGVGLRAHEIAKRLKQREDIQLSKHFLDGENPPFKKWPGALGSKSINWVRMGKQIRQEPNALYHLTNQSLSFLAKKVSPSIVTVHDLIEILEPQEWKAALINKYLYSGIDRADHLIAVSEYTKQAIIDRYSISPEKITVIPNGVGTEFHPIESFKTSLGYQELLGELKIEADTDVVLYVGSDHPRKNLPVALSAFHKASLHLGGVKGVIFVKVGAAGLPAGRAATLEVVDELKLREQVRFVDSVSTEKLNQLYNIADVLIFPSRFEGFGLPPLQALAAGTPVVASNATSIPEVVGNAAVLHDPDDIDAFAASLIRVLTEQSFAADLIQQRLKQARRFGWDIAAEQIIEVYKKIASIRDEDEEIVRQQLIKNAQHLYKI